MRLILYIALCVAMACFMFSPAMAFVVEGPKQTAKTAEDNLARAPRWPLSVGSMLESGERGLGGGLEYALDDSLCGLTFIDHADCGMVTQAVRDALAEWGSGHPAINFHDITGRLQPQFPRVPSDARIVGAEIDFFGSTPRQFRIFSNRAVNGYTVFYDVEQPSLVLTNGKIASGPISYISSADVHFNASSCYYIDPQYARETCVHFPSLVLHEISHVLGIGHPEDRIAFNLDSDDQPGNEIPIDCQAPTSGLHAVPAYDGAAVAHGHDVHRPGRWQRGLTWDDVAARDALYPHCAIERIERSPPRWGAFALGLHGRTGAAKLAYSPEEAAVSALADCETAGTGGNCHIVARFRDCFAFATSPDGAFGHARAVRSDHARVDAVLACSEAGKDCRVAMEFCAYD